MKDEAFFAVEKSQPQKIAIAEIAERPQIQRQPVPKPLLPEGALVGAAEEPSGWRGVGIGPSRLLFLCLAQRVPVVLVNPGGDCGLVAIVFDEIATQRDRGSADDEMVIDEVVGVQTNGAPPEQPEQIFRVVPAVPNPSPAEDLTAIEIAASRR